MSDVSLPIIFADSINCSKKIVNENLRFVESDLGEDVLPDVYDLQNGLRQDLQIVQLQFRPLPQRRRKIGG